MSFFYFRGPQACACHLVDQIPEHYCRGLISRQTGLAQHLQRVIGRRKIRVVAHGLIAGCPHKARRPIKFQRIRAADQQHCPRSIVACCARVGSKSKIWKNQRTACQANSVARGRRYQRWRGGHLRDWRRSEVGEDKGRQRRFGGLSFKWRESERERSIPVRRRLHATLRCFGICDFRRGLLLA